MTPLWARAGLREREMDALSGAKVGKPLEYVHDGRAVIDLYLDHSTSTLFVRNFSLTNSSSWHKDDSRTSSLGF